VKAENADIHAIRGKDRLLLTAGFAGRLEIRD
jgi:hypothetical protein